MEMRDKTYSTRLQIHILEDSAGMKLYADKKDVLITFDVDARETFGSLVSTSHDYGGFVLAEAGKVLRKSELTINFTKLLETVLVNFVCILHLSHTYTRTHTHARNRHYY